MSEIRNIRLPLDKLCAGHWSPRRILSYNRTLNIVTGPRGSGKSTGWPIQLVSRFCATRTNDPIIGEYPELFVFMRPDPRGYGESAPGYFDNVMQIIRDRLGITLDIKYKGGADGGEYLIDGQLAGYGFPLGRYLDYKSTTRRVYHMLLDEFVAEGKSTGGTGYNGGKARPMFDPEALMSLLVSYDRQVSDDYEGMFRNEVKIYLAGNNYSYNTPYYVYFGIDKYLRTDSKFIAPKGAEWVLEQTAPPPEYSRAAEKSNAAALMGARDAAYTFSNTAVQGADVSAFVKRPRGQLSAICNLVSDGDTYGVYMCADDGLVYIMEGQAPSGMCIALTAADHRPNYLMSIRFSDTLAMRTIRDAYLRGYLRFSSAKSKYVVDNYFMYVR